LAALLHGTVVMGVDQPNFAAGVEQRAPFIFGRAASRWELAHILVDVKCSKQKTVCMIFQPCTQIHVALAALRQRGWSGRTSGCYSHVLVSSSTFRFLFTIIGITPSSNWWTDFDDFAP